MRERIIRRSGIRNDCVGFCLACAQGKPVLSDSSKIGDEREPITWFYCDLPPLHSVTFPHPRGRGRKG